MAEPIDTSTLRVAFVQAQSQMMNEGKFEPVVVISKDLALRLLDEIDRLTRERAAAVADVLMLASWQTRAVTAMDALQDLVSSDETWAAIDDLRAEQSGDFGEESDHG